MLPNCIDILFNYMKIYNYMRYHKFPQLKRSGSIFTGLILLLEDAWIK